MTRKFYLFAVMTALFLLAPTSLWADQSGTCGDNIKWNLDDQGVLTLEGTGAMENFSDSPWRYANPSKVVIGDGITTIGMRAFESCMSLSSVTIPSSVTSIGEDAFRYCIRVKEIQSFAENPPACGDNAFGSMNKTECVLYVPANSIEAYKAATGWNEFPKYEALSGGTQSGTWGSNITWTLDDQGVLTLEGTGEIEFDYFEQVPWKSLSFTKLVIGDGITKIGQQVFKGCKGMTSVTIPSSVTSIEYYAFWECTGLTSVTIPSSVTSIAECTFQECTGLTSVTIPSSVTSIGRSAFYGCRGLTSVTIPSSVTSIESGAFGGCTGLTKIESLAETPPSCASNAFYRVNNCVLTVPANSVEAYKAAEGWKEFYSIVAGISSVTKGNNVSISASNGVITVAGVAGNNAVEVYSASGALVYRGTSNTVVVPSSGVYVVKAAGKTVKVNAAK